MKYWSAGSVAIRPSSTGSRSSWPAQPAQRRGSERHSDRRARSRARRDSLSRLALGALLALRASEPQHDPPLHADRRDAAPRRRHRVVCVDRRRGDRGDPRPSGRARSPCWATPSTNAAPGSSATAMRPHGGAFAAARGRARKPRVRHPLGRAGNRLLRPSERAVGMPLLAPGLAHRRAQLELLPGRRLRTAPAVALVALRARRPPEALHAGVHASPPLELRATRLRRRHVGALAPGVGPRRRRARRPRPSLRALRPDRRHPLVRRQDKWQEPATPSYSGCRRAGRTTGRPSGLRLELRADRYAAAFLPEAGRTFADSGNGHALSLTAMIRRPADWALACNREMARAATKYGVRPPRSAARLAAAPAPPLSDYLGRNTAAWERWAAQYVAAGRTAWQEAELRWGILGACTRVRAPALLGAEPGRRRRRARLRHRGNLGVARTEQPPPRGSRRGAPATPDRPSLPAGVRSLVPPDLRERREPFLRRRELRRRRLRVRGEPLVRSAAVGSRSRAACCATAAGSSSSRTGAMLIACTPKDGGAAQTALARDYFSTYRVEFSDKGPVEFHPTQGVDPPAARQRVRPREKTLLLSREEIWVG